MNYIVFLLLLLISALQYDLWVGKSSIVEVKELEAAIASQVAENKKLRERNDALSAEVMDLKHGLDAIEERVRNELGMIKRDETFFHIIKVKK